MARPSKCRSTAISSESKLAPTLSTECEGNLTSAAGIFRDTKEIEDSRPRGNAEPFSDGVSVCFVGGGRVSLFQSWLNLSLTAKLRRATVQRLEAGSSEIITHRGTIHPFHRAWKWDLFRGKTFLRFQPFLAGFHFIKRRPNNLTQIACTRVKKKHRLPNLVCRCSVKSGHPTILIGTCR